MMNFLIIEARRRISYHELRQRLKSLPINPVLRWLDPVRSAGCELNAFGVLLGTPNPPREVNRPVIEEKELTESTETEERPHKWVYLFEEGSGDNKSLFGGKGAGLCEMTQAGLPVPPGLIVTTEACNAFYANGKQFPEGMWEQVKEALHELEEKVGKGFGDAKNPLLVSVRSGAAYSMPGMMDTVLNLGLNEETVQGLAEPTGDLRSALDAYRRFASLFGELVIGVAHSKFERVMDRFKAQTTGGLDTDLKPEALRGIITAEKEIILA